MRKAIKKKVEEIINAFKNHEEDYISIYYHPMECDCGDHYGYNYPLSHKYELIINVYNDEDWNELYVDVSLWKNFTNIVYDEQFTR